MALTLGVNAYGDVAGAETYFTNRLDASGWLSGNATSKAQALITATSLIDTIDMVGVALSKTQPLAFPREGSYFDPKYGVVVTLSGIPDRVVKATYELANHLMTNTGMLDDTGRVLNVKVGDIDVERIRAPNRFPREVRMSLRPLQTDGSTNSWWRAN